MKLSLQDDKRFVGASPECEGSGDGGPSATVGLSLQDDNFINEVHRHGWDHDLGYGGGAAGETYS
jgi:hypothetical protein